VITCLTTSSDEVGDAKEGEKVWISASFKDVGKLDTHTAVIDWGDGTVSSGQVSKSCEGGSISGSHAYKWGGVYEIKVTLTDDDMGTAAKSVTAYITGAGVKDGVLQIVGTHCSDQVTVNQVAKNQLMVHANFLKDKGQSRTFDLKGIKRIEIYLGDGDDHATVAGNIDLPLFMDGGAGDDHLNAGRGPAVLIGGSGNDELMGSPSNDVIYGGSGNDFIQGNGGNDVLYGDAGCDVIYGSKGNDRIYGGEGNDRIYGGGGNDVLYGEAGCDVIYGSSGNDQIYGGDGNDFIDGGGGNDVLYGDAGCDVIYGSKGNDRIYGGDGDDWIFGEGGHDKLYGGSGDDRLFGGCGNDLILGEEGDDLLVGGGGRDTMDGGEGDDWLLDWNCKCLKPWSCHPAKIDLCFCFSWAKAFVDSMKGFGGEHHHKANHHGKCCWK
jgi:Ca2+-binding RTX toxin-like protein